MDKNIIFINKSKDIFGSLYDYSKVNYLNNKTKVEIICKDHGSFFIRPNDHLSSKNACPKCGILKRLKSQKNQNWEEDFNKIHNFKYNYSKVNYINNKTKVEIICKEHGSFFMKPNSHLSGQGCKKCSNMKVSSLHDFIKESNLKHNNLYSYTKSIYINSHSKIEIICKDHGSFFMKPCDHVNSTQGCPKCGKIKASNKTRKNTNLLIEQFKKNNGDIYDYSKIEYINNSSKIEIVCKKHGSFLQTPKSHLRGDGCPKCMCSKGERKIINYLEKNNIKYSIQKTFNNCLSQNGNKLKFDFYLEEFNLCIEYNGEQHYSAIDFFGGEDKYNKLIFNDNSKILFCNNSNIQLLIIKYTDYNNIDTILDNLLSIINI